MVGKKEGRSAKFGGDSRLRVRNRPAFLALLCVACLVVGLAVGYALVPSPVPDALRAPSDSGSVPVVEESFDDERTVVAVPQVNQGQSLAWQGGGTVTSLSVGDGSTIESGSSPFAVDGTPVVALYTEVPLYRDLQAGMSGGDVGALRDELVRLGYAAQVDGASHDVFDSSLWWAVAALQEAHGLEQTGVVSLQGVLWLPRQSVVLEDCMLVRGQAAPQEIGVMASSIQSIDVTLPDTLAQGERVITIAGEETALPEDGRIVDEAFLDKVEGTSQFAVWLMTDEGQRSGLDATIRLKEPITALKVPAGSVFSILDGVGCVRHDGEAVPVRLYGSQNGYAMVGLLDGSDASGLRSVDVSDGSSDITCPATVGETDDKGDAAGEET
ncbi:peptidoglycan-binding domain 1 protein [Bifidobacterium lemurum]|uniref:Peptidoglycan-binding domain 1 protein n=1 Tax=Bifidobacterium lemurum TaxID=1603886 RepID=A0A261FLF0_9BIFI|nr:peptidoglycan-binding domain 1 protein [Bifidobacterium lemurum]